MKRCCRLVLGISTLAVLVGWGIGTCEEERLALPKIEFKETSFDFGLLPPGKAVKLQHDFEFVNAGEAPLKITKLGTACLTVSESSSKVVLPGQSAHITVTINLYEGYAQQEEFVRRVDVQCNDPNKPMVTLELKARFGRSVETDCSNVDLGRVLAGEECERAVAIESKIDAPFQIEHVDYNKTLFDMRVEEKVTSGTFRNKGKKDSILPQQAVILRLRKDAPLGPINEVLSIRTDRSDVPVIEIPIVGDIVGDVLVDVDEVFLGIIEQGATFSKTVRLKAANKDFRVEKVTHSVPGLRVETNRTDTGATLTLAYDSTKAKGAVEGEICIRTSSPRNPEIKIKVYGFVQ
jgi:hypothetical protein